MSKSEIHKRSIMEFFELYVEREKQPVAHKHLSRELDDLIWITKKEHAVT